MMMLIANEARYFGEGLPDVGVKTALEAYEAGIAAAFRKDVKREGLCCPLRDGEVESDIVVPLDDLASNWARFAEIHQVVTEMFREVNADWVWRADVERRKRDEEDAMLDAAVMAPPPEVPLDTPSPMDVDDNPF